MCKYCKDFLTLNDYQPLMEYDTSTIFGDHYFTLNITRNFKTDKPVLEFMIGHTNDNIPVKQIPIKFCPKCGENLYKLWCEHKGEINK